VLDKFGSAKKLDIAMIRNGHLTDTDVDEVVVIAAHSPPYPALRGLYRLFMFRSERDKADGA